MVVKGFQTQKFQGTHARKVGDLLGSAFGIPL